MSSSKFTSERTPPKKVAIAVIILAAIGSIVAFGLAIDGEWPMWIASIIGLATAVLSIGLSSYAKSRGAPVLLVTLGSGEKARQIEIDPRRATNKDYEDAVVGDIEEPPAKGGGGK